MKIFRSIVGLIVGFIVTMLVITVVETTNFLIFLPADAPGLDDLSKFKEWCDAFQQDEKRTCAWMETLPIQAFVGTLIGWAVGAFVGGWVTARIAGWAYLLHAGLIGAFVLAATVINFIEMSAMGLSHPDWMIVLGLLLPLPSSLLGGRLATPRTFETPASNR